MAEPLEALAPLKLFNFFFFSYSSSIRHPKKKKKSPTYASYYSTSSKNFSGIPNMNCLAPPLTAANIELIIKKKSKNFISKKDSNSRRRKIFMNKKTKKLTL
jgi:hypothetical protein